MHMYPCMVLSINTCLKNIGIYIYIQHVCACIYPETNTYNIQPKYIQDKNNLHHHYTSYYVKCYANKKENMSNPRIMPPLLICPKSNLAAKHNRSGR